MRLESTDRRCHARLPCGVPMKLDCPRDEDLCPVTELSPRNRRSDIIAFAMSAAETVGVAMAPFLGPPPATCTWESLLAKPFVRKDGKVISGISTCGLFAEACLGEAGCGPESLREPYVFGTAIARIMTHARACDALRTDGSPVPGDYVCVHNAHGGEHVFVVVDVDGDEFVTVEGGQARADDGWLQSIRRRTRRLVGHDFGGESLAWFVDVDLI